MPLDKNWQLEQLERIDKILDIFSDYFGQDLLLVEKQIAIQHMGFYKFKFKYLPLEYDITFENDRGVFTIGIYDSEKAYNYLNSIEKFDNETTVKNAEYAIQILKNVLDKNNFCFYINRNGKLYKKQNQQYKRIKDWMTGFTGDNNGGTKK